MNPEAGETSDNHEWKVPILSETRRSVFSRFIVVAATTFLLILALELFLGFALGLIAGAIIGFLFWGSRMLIEKRKAAPSPASLPRFAQRCPYCGVAQAPRVPSCRSCGRYLTGSTVVHQPAASEYGYCENCGKRIPSGTPYCPHCGDKQGE
jgi:hypothetical protein